jgi:large subunit ribosomal protein L30
MGKESQLMKKLKITLKRSLIGRPKVQRLTVQALGIRKMNDTVEKEATPQILGMVKAVMHLIEVEEI